jgi:hypothetical protein
MKLNHPSISTGQGNQLVSLLPSALEPLKSLRDNKICEVLKRYAHTTQQCQILQILPKTRDTAKI